MNSFIKNESENQNKTCLNCMSSRSGECFGSLKICEFFKYAPNIKKERIELWPKYGDATLIRMKLF